MVTRETWIDAWKGGLILAVVIGHVVGGGSHFATGDARAFLRGIYFWIYSFHMPAFFFVAGWLWRRKEFSPFLVGRLKRLVVPYFSVGVISIVIFLSLHGGAVSGVTDAYYVESAGDAGGLVESLLALIHAGGWPNGNGFRFNSVLWFLPCMFTAELIYWCVDGLIPSRRIQLVLVVLMLVGCFELRHVHVPALPWGADKMLRFLPWLILGRWSRELLAGKRVAKSWELLTLVALHVCLVWLCWNVFTGPGKYWVGALAIVAGILFSLEVSQSLVRSLALAKGLSALGVSSLSIMLWHKFFVAGAQMKLPIVKALYGSGVFGAVVASAAITGASVIVVLTGNRIYDMLASRIRRGL